MRCEVLPGIPKSRYDRMLWSGVASAQALTSIEHHKKGLVILQRAWRCPHRCLFHVAQGPTHKPGIAKTVAVDAIVRVIHPALAQELDRKGGAKAGDSLARLRHACCNEGRIAICSTAVPLSRGLEVLPMY